MSLWSGLKSLGHKVVDGAEHAVKDAAHDAAAAAKWVGKQASDPNSGFSQIGHTVLDVAGMVPVVGAAADGINAAWYAGQGDFVNAGLSLASAIPGAGDALAGARLAKRGASLVEGGVKAAKEARTVGKGVHTAETAAKDAVKSTKSAEAEAKGVLGRHAGTEAGGRAEESAKTCDSVGHPVNPATGIMFTEEQDFALPGPLPLAFKRIWTSSSGIVGELGHGWHHSLDMALLDDPADGTGRMLLRLADGRCTPFARPAPGTSSLNTVERFQLWAGSDEAFWATDYDGLRHEFGPRRGGLRHLVRIADPNGNEVRLRRDGAGILAGIVASAGRELSVRHDQAGRIVAIDGPHPCGVGQLTLVRFAYDAAGDLVASADANGARFTYAYDRHLMTRERHPGGLLFHFRWDDPALGRDARCVETWGEAGPAGGDGVPAGLYHRRLSYDPAARRAEVRDGAGGTEIYEWDETGRVVARTDALGRRTAFVRDLAGRVVEETRADGAVRRQTFDACGRLVAETDHAGARTAWLYAPPGADGRIGALPVQVTLPGNRVHRHAYDERGNLVASTGPGGRVLSYLRDGRGLPLAVLDELGRLRRYGWTEAGDLHWEATGRGPLAAYAHDALGRLVSFKQPGGEVTYFVRDAAGNPLEVRRSDGRRTVLAYDAEGRVTRHRDALGHETRWDYGGLPFPLRRLNADGAEVHYAYDGELNLVGLTNPKGERYALAYDAAGQLVEEVGFDGRRRGYAYDAAGHLARHEDEEGRGASYRRDPLGRLLRRLYADGTEDRFAYDAAGRLTRAENAHRTVGYAYAPDGALVEERQDGWTLRHRHDARGRRVATELPDGRVVEVDWEADDAFAEVRFDGRRVARVERDGLGREVLRQAGGVEVESSYDPQGRLLRQAARGRGLGHGPAFGRTYGYDEADRVVLIDDARGGVRRYGYDACERLLAVGGDAPESFVWDPAGNILGANGEAPGVAAGDRLQLRGDRKFEYDRCGNRVREQRGAGGGVEVRYEYGPDNQLVCVEEQDRRGRKVTRFAYDALGRRVRKEHRAYGPAPANDGVGGPAAAGELPLVAVRTWFLWDGDALLAEAAGDPDAKAPADALEMVYLHEPGTFRPLAQVRRGGADGAGGVLHYHLDHLGTPREVTNDDGRVVWRAQLRAWGAVAREAVAEVGQPLRFQGQYHDAETGLHYNRFRYYSPAEGCFVHQDPIRLAGGLNVAAYAPNPVRWIDPFGLSKDCEFGPEKPDAEWLNGQRYEDAAYHGQSAQTGPHGVKSAAPKDGTAALNNSYRVSENSPRRVGVDTANKEFVVLDRTAEGLWHGHVRPWDQLHQNMRNTLVKHSVTNLRGKIIGS